MGAGLALPPGMVERLVDSATTRLRAAEDMGNSPVLVCAAPLRAPLSRLLRTSSPACLSCRTPRSTPPCGSKRWE